MVVQKMSGRFSDNLGGTAGRYVLSLDWDKTFFYFPEGVTIMLLTKRWRRGSRSAIHYRNDI